MGLSSLSGVFGVSSLKLGGFWNMISRRVAKGSFRQGERCFAISCCSTAKSFCACASFHDVLLLLFREA
jgi:hypothetical protein